MAELDVRRAQILSNAAKTIQRKTRTHLTRKHFLLCSMQQSLCSLYAEEAASLNIQTKYRGHFARMSYTKLKRSVFVLQAGMQAMAAHSLVRGGAECYCCNACSFSRTLCCMWHTTLLRGDSVSSCGG